MGAALSAVIFDWGGTLTPWHVIDGLQAWSVAHGDQAVGQRLHAAETAVWATSRDEHRSGSLTDILAAAGVDHNDELIARYDQWWDQHTVTDPQAAPMLRALRSRGLRIVVLSNTIWTRARHESIFERDGVLDLIDGAVYTSEIPWTKPHPEAFRAALDAVGLDDPSRAVFVGDRPFDDIHGARSAGMRTVLIPHSDIPDEQRGHTEGEPDAVIHELSELVGVIDGWLA